MTEIRREITIEELGIKEESPYRGEIGLTSEEAHLRMLLSPVGIPLWFLGRVLSAVNHIIGGDK